MTSHHSDILLPRAAWGSTTGRSQLIAFIPIVVALIGVGAIFLGGITARSVEIGGMAISDVDPMTTGSIATADQRRALQMLDL
jgi:hypothetical protein